MKKLKKLLPLILAVVLFAQCIIMPASAVPTTDDLNGKYTNPPGIFWKIFGEIGTARDSGNLRGVITAVQKLYDLFVGSANPETIADSWLKNSDVELDVLTPRILWAGEAAEALGDSDEMIKWYNRYLIFAPRWNYLVLVNKSPRTEAQRRDLETFLIPSLKTKIAAYTVEPAFFTEIAPDNSTNPYTGAKYEPRNGILYGSADPYDVAGITSGNSLIEANSKTPSGILFYVKFKTEKIRDYDWALKELAGKSDIIQIAWNVDQKQISLKDAVKQTDLINETANYLAELGTPILLRVAAEMNVWNPPANPEEFKTFFITVAKIMKDRAPNVAMLFSPNDISASGVTIKDYYPGDEYVDWIGVSNYYQYYFGDGRDGDDFNLAVYGNADYANPIRKLDEIVKLFGGKKPIMLSEYGVANSSRKFANGARESTVAWAKYRLAQLQYYVPMFYPEIKAMFYFDVIRDEPNHYTLRNNSEMNELYNKFMRENGIYLSKGKESSDFIYDRIDASGSVLNANKVIINTYAEVMKYPELTVTYSVGGKQYAKATQIPYRAVLDFSGFADGIYNIEISVKTTSDGKERANKNIQAAKNGNSVILIETAKPSSWAEAPINAAVAANLLPQKLQSSYNQATTRAEFCALAVALYEKVTGKTITDRIKFTDTSDENVEKAAAIKVVSGVGDNKFNPNGTITREHAATMLSRLADAVGKPLTKSATTFADKSNISSWALEAVGQMQATGIMTGVGSNMFAPKSSYTREQSIITTMRLYEIVK